MKAVRANRAVFFVCRACYTVAHWGRENMLKEFTRLRQDKTGFRRLFTDDTLDLYIWYPDNSDPKITGFQLVYTHKESQKALTWLENGGFFHNAIHEDDSKLINKSPMLVQDGTFDYTFVHGELVSRIGGIEPAVRDFVLAKMAQFDRTR